LKSTKKDTVVAYFKLLFLYMTGGSEENHKT